MGGGYLETPAVFLVQVIFGLYTTLVMLRFLLQLMRADFYNPLSQFIVKATKPALNPMRRIIPSVGGLDTASLVLAWIVATIEWLIILAIMGKGFAPTVAMLYAVASLVELVIFIFLFAIAVQAIVSWINPGAVNPILGLMHSLTEPLVAPVRRRMPDTGGIDFSPMIVFIGLIVLAMLVVPPIRGLIG